MSNGEGSQGTPSGPLSWNVAFDDERDIATVYGVKISGALLRVFGEPTPPGVWIRVIKVEDGMATIEQRTDLASVSETSTLEALKHANGMCRSAFAMGFIYITTVMIYKGFSPLKNILDYSAKTWIIESVAYRYAARPRLGAPEGETDDYLP
jgi:hypothetical protein